MKASSLLPPEVGVPRHLIPTIYEFTIWSILAAIPIDQLKKYHQLVHSAELLLYKLDDTILEARLAREAMLLYIQVKKV